jgi:hypothetical protein
MGTTKLKEAHYKAVADDSVPLQDRDRSLGMDIVVMRHKLLV